jgi:2-oxoglutarate dehydrogenase E2 component (dihydrolipoamide succinyltransferase)
MEHKITIPFTADGALNVTILRWIKSVGERVTRGQDIAEAKTEKINLNITAPTDGILAEIISPVGTQVRVGDVIGIVREE